MPCVADVLEDLSDHDALFIAEADAYERCQALARSVLVPTAVHLLQVLQVPQQQLTVVSKDVHKPLNFSATVWTSCVFPCCRGFQQLSGSQSTQAVDVLAANLRYICTSAQQLLSDEEPASPETLQKHRNGLKMIVHLLHIIAMQAQKDAEAAKGAENAAAKPTKGVCVSCSWTCASVPHTNGREPSSLCYHTQQCTTERQS